MIKNKIKLERFYKELIRRENISYKEALKIYEALHKEAILLDAINSRNILTGIDVDIRIAKTINRLS